MNFDLLQKHTSENSEDNVFDKTEDQNYMWLINVQRYKGVA